MADSVRSAAMAAIDDNGDNVSMDVLGPALGSRRGWGSTGEFIIDMFGRIGSGENFFYDDGQFAYSDPRITLVAQQGEVSYNQVRAVMHQVRAEAVAENRLRNAGWLQQRFESLMTNRGTPMRFIGGQGERGVFQTNLVRRNARRGVRGAVPIPPPRRNPSREARAVGGSSRRTGVRRGNASFRSVEQGQVVDVRNAVTRNRGKFEDILRENPDWCFQHMSFNSTDWVRSTVQQTVDIVMEMSCVILGVWLRFSRSPFALSILKHMGQEATREELNVGFKQPPAIGRMKSKFLFEIVRVLAGSRKKDAFMYWSTEMGSPIIDTEIFALALRFEVNIKIIQAGALIAYKRMAEKESTTGMLVKTEDFDGFRTEKKNLRVMMNFKGSKRKTGRFDRRRFGHEMIMVCSSLCDLDAHVDIVFDPLTEVYLLGSSHTNFMCDVEYDRSKNPRCDEGYFDQLATGLSPNPFKPRRMYAELETWTVADFIQETAPPRLRFIDTPEEFEVYKSEMLQAVCACFPANLSHRGEVDTDVIGLTVLIDSRVVASIAEDEFGMDERRINGLVYYMGAFYNAFDEAGLLNKIDFTQFNSTMARKRSARIFNQQIALDPDEDNRVDVISGFDDVYSFELNLKEQITMKSVQGPRVGINKLFTFMTYDKDLMNIGRSLVREPWILKEKKKAIDVIAEGMVAKKKQGMRSKVQLVEEKMNDPSLDEWLAYTISRKSITLARMGGVPKLVDRINNLFGTYAPVQDEIVHVFDPQIDEPVACVAVLSERKRATKTEGHWEMDASLFYTQTAVGKFDAMIEADFFEEKWVSGSPRRAVHTILEEEEVLTSYEAHFGYAWVEDIDFEKLRLHIGLNELNSWWKFAESNPDSVQRRVHCGSVIHFTSFVAKVIKGKHDAYNAHSVGVRPWLYGKDRKAVWCWIQREVLKINNVYFYHASDEREAIVRFKEYKQEFPDKRVMISDRLNGLVIAEKNESEMKEIHVGIHQTYASVLQIFKAAGLCDKDARKAAKFDFNRSIGLLKNGQYFSNVASRTTSDVIQVADNKGEGGDYTFMGIPFPRESMVQVCMRELPNTPVVLSEMIHVVPVTLAGYPKSLRIDILERARLVMDIMIEKSSAFMVKTDAVFFKDRYLQNVLDYLHEVFPTVFADSMGDDILKDDLVYGAQQCDMFECTANKYCDDHSPLPTIHDNLIGMLPFKFIFHKGISSDVSSSAIGAMGEDHVILNYVEGTSDEPSLMKLSANGRDMLKKSLGALPPLVSFSTSDMMPTIDELVAAGACDMQAAQSIDCSPTVFEDRLQEHCHIHGDGAIVYVGEEDMAQPVTIHNDTRNKMYLDNIFKTVDSLDGGFLMEGPPGAGKTFAVVEYIKREYEQSPDTIFFVATATHLTLEPYKSLNSFEEYRREGVETVGHGKRINVCTIHSMIGVFTEMEEASRNPHKWLHDKANKFKSRLMTALRQATPNTKVFIFVDEYEMLPQYAEEMLLYISNMDKVRMVLLGDKFQTAAKGRGIRCTGNVIKTISNNTIIHFDLPFRNADYEYVCAQRDACNGNPTMFLKQPLSNYTAITSRKDDVYLDTIDKLAKAYLDASNKDYEIYRDPVVSLQNYKAIGVVTLDIMARVQEMKFMSPICAIPFCGNTHFTKGEVGMDTGSVDVETSDVASESPRVKEIGEENFKKKLSHFGYRDPAGKGFLVGTMVNYEAGFSYRSMYAFTPKIRGTDNNKPVLQSAIRMGQVMRFVGFERKDVKVAVNGGKKFARVRIKWGKFLKEDGSKMVLMKEEMQAYMYYPFCLYTEGVVGHTFDRYTMMKFSDRSEKAYDYLSLKKSVTDIQNMLGDKAWLSPVVKSLNVAVSRVTKGNRADIIEINEGKKGFWRNTLTRSKWHILGQGLNELSYNNQLCEMRRVVIKSTHVVQVEGSLSLLF